MQLHFPSNQPGSPGVSLLDTEPASWAQVGGVVITLKFSVIVFLIHWAPQGNKLVSFMYRDENVLTSSSHRDWKTYLCHIISIAMVVLKMEQLLQPSPWYGCKFLEPSNTYWIRNSGWESSVVAEGSDTFTLTTALKSYSTLFFQACVGRTLGVVSGLWLLWT